MLRFFARSFTVAFCELDRAANELGLLLITPNPAPIPELRREFIWTNVERYVGDINKEVENLPLSFSLKDQLKRLKDRVANHSEENVSVAIAVLQEARKNLENELSQHLYMMIPSDLAGLYMHPETLFGEETESKFPDAVKDMHDGIRCFVLDRWTASVFHFMRVLEHAIHWLSNDVGVSTANVSLENWKNILDQIEKKIRELEQLLKSQQKTDDLKFYSEAAANFRYFKDAWRNHVSHARVTYDSGDAKRVMDHVADFMRHLTARIP
jgi:hypothetical protein